MRKWFLTGLALAISLAAPNTFGLIFPLQPNERGTYDPSFNVIEGYNELWRTNHHAVYNLLSMNAVAVSPRWLLTAWHVAGNLDTNYYINDDSQRYYYVDRVNLGNDLALVKVDQPLPFYSRISKDPGGDGDLMTVYGQSASPIEPILDKDLIPRGWKFAAVTNNPRLRWGHARRLASHLSNIEWDFTNRDPDMGLTCATVNTNDSGGGIFLGDEVVGVITGLQTLGFRDSLNDPISTNCDINPLGHVYDSSTLYRCFSSFHPFTHAFGAPVYIALSNIFATIAPPRFFNVGGPLITENGHTWESASCAGCSYNAENNAAPVDLSHVSQPAPEMVYRSAAFIRGQPTGEMAFAFDELLKYEKYVVRLHFAGFAPADAPGAATETILVNGQQQVFDPFVGAGQASALTFTDVTPDDGGRITILIRPNNPAGNAVISGIEIAMKPFTPTPPKELQWETVATYPQILNLFNCVFGNGTFVANGVTLLFSADDGLSWQLPRGVKTRTAYDQLIFGGGTFIASGFTDNPLAGVILSSRDGHQWDEQFHGRLVRSLSYNDGRFTAGFYDTVFNDGDLYRTNFGSMTSTDGTIWVTNSLPSNSGNSQSPSNVASGNGWYVSVLVNSASFSFLRGANIQNLEHIEEPAQPTLRTRIARSGARLVVTSPYPRMPIPILVSDDAGASFAPVNLPDGVNFLRGVAYGPGHFIAVGDRGTIVQAQDARNWTRVMVQSIATLHDIVSDGTIWIAVGEAGTVLLSRDGSSFISPPSGTTEDLNGIAAGGGIFCAVGGAGTVLTSTNGSDWTLQKTSAADLFSVAYGNGRFVAVGTNGYVEVSTNGKDWTSGRASGATLPAVAFGHGFFITVEPTTYRGLLSIDGLSWSPIPIPQGSQFTSGSDGELWLTGSAGTSFIAKAQFTTGDIILQADEREDGLFSFTFEVPAGGDYAILSASNLLAPEWRTETILSSGLLRQLTWNATNTFDHQRFFRVRGN